MTQTSHVEILDFYRQPDAMESAGARVALFDGLPDDVASLARVLQGLLIHQHIAPAYGETLTASRIAEVQARPVSAVLANIVGHDSRPLAAPRPPAKRVVGNCRHYSLLLVSMLRGKGVPARARCGFGAYFTKGKFVDHWVCEYWNGKRWVMADAQIDDTQKNLFKPDFDTLDVPRDRFVIAGDAWKSCRDGKTDPADFGIMEMNGWWFVAGNLVRDIAALNNMVMLPWDVWGAMPQPGAAIDETAFKRFDRLAALTHDAGAHFAELRALYAQDDGLKVPPTVFNAILNRPEQI
ncbi:MAG TPA: transglutaminase family protein [Rhizomicrobium sp.]